MSIFVTINGICVDREIHSGDTAMQTLMNNNSQQVQSIQADGDELEMIRSQFTNLRMHSGRVVEWFGDDAVFIARHLR